MRRTEAKRFSRLVEPHLDALFRAAYRLSRNQADAEDLVQETCIRACQRINQLRDSRPVKPWLLRVLHNVFVDEVRRAQRAPFNHAIDGTDTVVESASSDPTPEEALHVAEREAELERAWRRLDRGHRALLALRAEGYSLPEIADITNLAIDALTMRLYRARQSLTKCLKEERALPTESAPMEVVK